MACTSIKESEVPGLGVKCTREEDAWECGMTAAFGSVNREERLGETGSAVRFACFLSILRVASPVANWN